MKRALILVSICLGLLAGCASKAKLGIAGPYLDYDEARGFKVDEDEDFSSRRPEYLMKYWTLSPVKLADRKVLSEASTKRLFPVEKEGFLYFSIAYPYEHYVWGPSTQDPKLITIKAKYWVYGLDRYKTPL